MRRSLHFRWVLASVASRSPLGRAAFFFALAAALALALALAPAVLARPGGGNKYHGSPAHPSGGFHSDHGARPSAGWGGYNGAFPVPFGASSPDGYPPFAPMIVVFLVLAVGIGVLFFQARARTIRRSGAEGPDALDRTSPPSLEDLRENDPALTEEGLTERVRVMADVLRSAWCDGAMDPARAFLSDGVFSRFRVQLVLMAAENRRNVMGDARILGATLVCATRLAPLDVVEVRVSGEARDAEVPRDATPERVEAALAAKPRAPYAEVWTLVRRQGARTQAQGFAVGQSCPACGAPLTTGAMVKCRYCGALVCSGEHDWVLAEITQESEWRSADARPYGGDVVEPLRGVDPLIARQVLEDRASTVFWKWIEAGRFDRAALAPLAMSSFLSTRDALTWAAGASDVAVGSARVVSCAPGGGDGFDRVEVEIRWSARFGGAASFTPVHSRLRLARRAGVLSVVSMTALLCRACGAPLGSSDQPHCAHCGAPLANGDQTWVLEALSSQAMPAG